MYVETEMSPCNYGRRVIAYLLDILFVWAPMVASVPVGIVLLFRSPTRLLGILLLVAGPLWFIGSLIWNEIIRQGRTGQTIGKSQQNIKLVNEKTGQAPGIRTVFVRVLVAYIFNALTGGIFLIVDLLFPAFDSRKQRIMDKICSTLVIDTFSSPNVFTTGPGSNCSAPSDATAPDPLN